MIQLEETIGYKFKDKALLELALTHSSYAHEHYHGHEMGKDNERLEFLGDAVLELISSDYLFRNHGEYPEGQLTKLRASIVCEPSLAACARVINLGAYLKLGLGEDQAGGRQRDSITSDAFEALIGAIYLDGGFANAKDFVVRFVLSDLENKKLFYDSKTILQELVQRDFDEQLKYELIAQEGPDHNKSYKMQAFIGERPCGVGTGHTKKAAQQMAAYETILMLRNSK